MDPAALLLAIRLGLALVLYAFLGLVLLYLWRDFRAIAHGPTQIPQAYLELISEPEPGKGYPLGATNLIGRSSDNSIVLDEATVSSHHARLVFQMGQWWLEDLGSKNGTGVNDLDVEDPLVVTFGDRIRFGNVNARLKSGAASARPEASPETVGT